MATPQPTTRSGGVVATLALAGTVAAIMQTLVTPLIGDLPQILDSTPSNTAWVITVTLLVSAVCVPVSGRLGDLLGKRRMLLICTVPLIIGSVVCALSSTVLPMIIGRGLQGMGMGMVPLGIALLRDVVPAEKLSSSIALVSASMGIGGGIGLPIAAAVSEYASWRVLFWGAAGLSAVIAVMIWMFVPSLPAPGKGQRFDGVGAVGLAIGLVCLLLAVSKGGDWGWGSGSTLGLFGAAVVVLLLWGYWELRTREPLVDLRATARPRVLMTNIASIFVGFGMYASMLIMPQLLQFPEATGYGLGQSMLAAGLWMAPGGIMMMIVSPLGGKLTNARGPKFTLLCGVLVVAAGYGAAMLLMGTAWGIMLTAMITSGGVGLAYGAMPALIMSSVRQDETAAANAFNTLMRSLGTSIGAAVIGVVLAQMTTTMGGQTFTSEGGFRTGMMVGCGVALVAFVIAVFIPVLQKTGEQEEATQDVPTEGSDSAATDVRNATPVPTQTGTGTPVSGRVQDAEKAPVAQAAVTVISLGGRQLGRAITRNDGSYSLDVPGAGSYILITAAHGHAPQASTVLVGDEPLSHEILLSGTSGLSGVIRAAESHDPVVAATLVVTDVRGDVLAAAASDDDGAFTLSDLAPGTVTVAVNAGGFRPAALPVEVAGTGVTRVTIELCSGAEVRGTVLTRSGPLNDARVTLVDGAGNVVATTATDLDGTYAFADLDTGDYTLIARGYPPKADAVSVRDGVVQGLDIALDHPAR
ncbi:MFS transporter [Streptomyces sp. NPDC002790]|uniref:MFS transporter n=1 Tax=Streptomyces sp. NPDC002790 TaxID=3154431 RepID=UPI00331819C8